MLVLNYFKKKSSWYLGDYPGNVNLKFWILEFRRKSKASEEEFLSLKFWGLGIRLLNKTLSLFSFFSILSCKFFFNFSWRPNCRNQLGLLILAFIVVWKWPNLYLNDRIQMKTNHNWYLKKPQNRRKFWKFRKFGILERKYQNCTSNYPNGKSDFRISRW